jgi:hypothetical protein
MSPAEPPSSNAGSDEPRLSFKEREMLLSLRRLANARSQLDQLEEKLATQQQRTAWDPDDLLRAETSQAEIEKLRHKAQSRFGGASARERLGEAELQQRLLFERLGVGSFDELQTRRRNPVPAGEQVDPVFVEFARRELSSAEEAYRQVLDLPDDDAPEGPHRTGEVDEHGETVEPPAGGEGGDDLTEVPEYPPAIDLTRPEAS